MAYTRKEDVTPSDPPHILFTPSNYPSGIKPYVFTFVQEFVRAVAKAGVRCSVVSPVRLRERLIGCMKDDKTTDVAVADNPIRVSRPSYFSFSKKNLLGFNTGYFTYLAFRNACRRSLRALDRPPDFVYGHFMYPGGATAVHLGRQLGVPSFVRAGESGEWSLESAGLRKAARDFSGVSGIIANSWDMKLALERRLDMDQDRIVVFNNGVNRSVFYPRERFSMRKEHGLPNDKFIICFVGHFDERKGPHRVIDAVRGIDDIGLVFIGSGPVRFDEPRILFQGVIPHDGVPEYLSASDVFVLPTLREGSCNAVLEALACGLPVVSSNRGFNRAVLDDTCSILVEPTDIKQIRDAVVVLKENKELRFRLKEGALNRAEELDIYRSAKRILEWMKKKGNLTRHAEKVAFN